MPFYKYWCAVYTVVKTNCLWQSSIQEIPRELWERTSTACSPFVRAGINFERFRPFREYAYVAQLKRLGKQQPRAVPVRYLYSENSGNYRVLLPNTGQIFRCRRANYRPYNPRALEMPGTNSSAARVTLTTCESTSCHTGNGFCDTSVAVCAYHALVPPHTLRAARQASDAAHWRASYPR